MKIQIENLRAQMRGVQLNDYQKALALDEYYKLLDYVEELEQLTMPAISNSVCSFFEPDNKTSSATKCICGREKWEHPNEV